MNENLKIISDNNDGNMSKNHETELFKTPKDGAISIKNIIVEVYKALAERGYNPSNQFIGYIISDDPTYITAKNNARNLVKGVPREDILEELLKYYIANNSAS